MKVFATIEWTYEETIEIEVDDGFAELVELKCDQRRDEQREEELSQDLWEDVQEAIFPRGGEIICVEDEHGNWLA